MSSVNLIRSLVILFCWKGENLLETARCLFDTIGVLRFSIKQNEWNSMDIFVTLNLASCSSLSSEVNLFLSCSSASSAAEIPISDVGFVIPAACSIIIPNDKETNAKELGDYNNKMKCPTFSTLAHRPSNFCASCSLSSSFSC